MTKVLPLAAKTLAQIGCVFLLAAPVTYQITQDHTGYAPVPSASERQSGETEYSYFPPFPHIELVDETTGRVNPDLVKLISDPDLRRAVEDGKFSSLQVRNFTPRLGEVRLTPEGKVIPFGLTLKHFEWPWTQGSLEAAGEMTVGNDGKISARIDRFYDSQLPETVSRYYFLKQGIDLNFARAIGEPQLVNWFEKNPNAFDKGVGLVPFLP